jgi:TonB family protein
MKARRLAALVLLLLGSSWAAAPGQTTGAVITKQTKPVYPEIASKGLRQGNVNLIGRIDAKGRVQDLRYVGSTIEAFIEPAVAAVNSWEFKPATRGGKPVEIAANIALRFRLEGDKHGEISSPILGDLSVFPADSTGRAVAPDGFPIRRATDPKMRVETVLDVSPEGKPRSVPVRVEAISPIGKKIVVFEQSVPVKAKATDVKIPFTVTVDPDWEDGVWLLRFVVDKAEAGGGQFWVAVDPEHYSFVLPGRPLTAAAEKGKRAAPAGSSAPAPARPTATPRKTRS